MYRPPRHRRLSERAASRALNTPGNSLLKQGVGMLTTMAITTVVSAGWGSLMRAAGAGIEGGVLKAAGLKAEESGMLTTTRKITEATGKTSGFLYSFGRNLKKTGSVIQAISRTSYAAKQAGKGGILAKLGAIPWESQKAWTHYTSVVASEFGKEGFGGHGAEPYIGLFYSGNAKIAAARPSFGQVLFHHAMDAAVAMPAFYLASKVTGESRTPIGFKDFGHYVSHNYLGFMVASPIFSSIMHTPGSVMGLMTRFGNTENGKAIYRGIGSVLKPVGKALYKSGRFAAKFIGGIAHYKTLKASLKMAKESWNKEIFSTAQATETTLSHHVNTMDVIRLNFNRISDIKDGAGHSVYKPVVNNLKEDYKGFIEKEGFLKEHGLLQEGERYEPSKFQKFLSSVLGMHAHIRELTKIERSKMRKFRSKIFGNHGGEFLEKVHVVDGFGFEKDGKFHRVLDFNNKDFTNIMAKVNKFKMATLPVARILLPQQLYQRMYEAKHAMKIVHTKRAVGASGQIYDRLRVSVYHNHKVRIYHSLDLQESGFGKQMETLLGSTSGLQNDIKKILLKQKQGKKLEIPEAVKLNLWDNGIGTLLEGQRLPTVSNWRTKSITDNVLTFASEHNNVTLYRANSNDFIERELRDAAGEPDKSVTGTDPETGTMLGHGSIFQRMKYILKNIGPKPSENESIDGFFNKASGNTGFFTFTKSKIDDIFNNEDIFADINTFGDLADKFKEGTGEPADLAKQTGKGMEMIWKLQDLLNKNSIIGNNTLKKYKLSNLKNPLRDNGQFRDQLKRYMESQYDVHDEETLNNLLDNYSDIFEKIMSGNADHKDLLKLAAQKDLRPVVENMALDKKTKNYLRRFYDTLDPDLIDKQSEIDAKVDAFVHMDNGADTAIHHGGKLKDYFVKDDLEQGFLSEIIGGATDNNIHNVDAFIGDISAGSNLKSGVEKKITELFYTSAHRNMLANYFKQMGTSNPLRLFDMKFDTESMGKFIDNTNLLFTKMSSFTPKVNTKPWIQKIDRQWHGAGNFFFTRPGSISPFSALAQGFPGKRVDPYENKIGTFSNFLNFAKQFGGEYTVLPKEGPFGVGNAFEGLTGRSIFRRFNGALELFGLGADTKGAQTNLHIATRMAGALGKNIALFGALNVANDISAAFIKGGILGQIAKPFAAVDIGLAEVRDKLGLTKGAQYLEGLMPGVFSSAGSHIFKTVATMALGGQLSATLQAGTLATSAIMGVSTILGLSSDPTKSAQELKDEYSGRKMVPVRKNRFWALSSSPYEGQRIEGYVPNWYIRLTSGYKYTSDIYGSPLRAAFHRPLPLIGANIGDIFDPYYNEKRLYFRRPAQYSTPEFNDLPVLGPIVSSTLGSIIKPSISLSPWQQWEDEGKMVQIPGKGITSQRVVQEAVTGSPSTIYKQGAGQGGAATMHPPDIVNPYKSNLVGSAMFRGISKPLGLFGYASEVLMGTPGANPGMFGIQQNGPAPELGRGSEQKFSASHSWWDAERGDFGFMTEPLRRLFPRDPFKNYYTSGPVNGTMPYWLPFHLRQGDPFTSVKMGELRLPGTGFISTHATARQDFPISAGFLGFSPDVVARFETGAIKSTPLDLRNSDKTALMKEQVMMDLATTNKIIKTRALVYDPYNNIDGTVDAVIQSGKDKLPVTIKRVSARDFQKVSENSPLERNYAELQFYMNTMNAKEGKIIYVNDEDPEQRKQIDVEYNPEAYEKVIETARQARNLSADLIKRGIGYAGSGLSWVDRAQILADVAPFSNEYKTAVQIVNLRKKYGMLTPADKKKLQTVQQIRQNRAMGLETYERRFKLSQLLNPSAQMAVTNTNTYIKAAADYNLPERMLGSVWEYTSHANTWLNRKFMNRFSAKELLMYKHIYGTNTTRWESPIKTWIEPNITMAAAPGEDLLSTVISNVGQLATFGSFFGVGGGRVGAVFGGAGAAASFLNLGRGKEAKEGQTMLDLASMDLIRAQDQYSKTFSSEDAEAIQNNMVSVLSQNTPPTFKQIIRATPLKYKNIIGSILSLPAKQQIDIAKDLPGPLQVLVDRYAGQNNVETPLANNAYNAETVASMTPEEYDQYKIKYIEDTYGEDPHNYGLGFPGKRREKASIALTPSEPINIKKSATEKEQIVKQAVINLLSRYGVEADVSVSVTGGHNINIVIG